MLQWADTFNRYGTDASLLLNGAWIENHGTGTLVADPDVSSAAKVYKANAGFADAPAPFGLRYALASNQPTVGIAGKLWMSQIPSDTGNATPGFDWRDVSNNIICRITVNLVGGIAAYNAVGTKIGETSVPVLTANSWNHIEAKVLRSATVGTLEVRVNGQAAQLALTGLNLGAVDFAQVNIGGYHAAAGPGGTFCIPYWKDVIIWDGTGTYNNNFMGTCSVIDIDVDSDVALGWTPSAGGVGWSILDNNPPTDDAAYIAAAAAALTNTFGLQDLPADVTTVRGGVIINRSRKIDGGDGNVQAGLISGASTGLGADRPVTVAYTYWKDVFEVDPNTGVPFIPANFNLAKLKLTRTV
jgi:hypothetical protein